uniref:Putative ovule protein n=1 Tax=Solanum chacoense TaxID=4108 RepID=A0A0V0IPS8_SOLCH
MGTHFCLNFQTNTWRSKPYKGNGDGRIAASIWNGGTLLIGRIPNSLTIKEIWITLVGIPLHLRSQKVFQKLEESVEDGLQLKEETELKNQMKWARILVASDGRKIPKEVSIEWNEITYHFPIWVECNPRFEIAPESGYGTNGEETRLNPVHGFTQGII